MPFRTMKETGAPTYVDRLQTWDRYTSQQSNYHTPGIPFAFEQKQGAMSGCGACGGLGQAETIGAALAMAPIAGALVGYMWWPKGWKGAVVGYFGVGVLATLLAGMAIDAGVIDAPY